MGIGDYHSRTRPSPSVGDKGPSTVRGVMMSPWALIGLRPISTACLQLDWWSRSGASHHQYYSRKAKKEKCVITRREKVKGYHKEGKTRDFREEEQT